MGVVQKAPERAILPDPTPTPPHPDRACPIWASKVRISASPRSVGRKPALIPETKRAAPLGGSFVAMILAQYTPPAWAAAPASGGTVAGGPEGAAT